MVQRRVLKMLRVYIMDQERRLAVMQIVLVGVDFIIMMTQEWDVNVDVFQVIHFSIIGGRGSIVLVVEGRVIECG